MAAATKIVPADDLPANLVPADDLPDDLGQEEPATMTKMAAPRAEGFFSHLGTEAIGGAGDIVSGIKKAVSPLGPSLAPVNQALGIGEAAMGALRLFTSPITAAGHKAGEVSQDIAMSMGAGPNVSAGIATAADMATQLVGAPKAISAAAPQVMRLIKAGARNLPGAQVTLREMGKKLVEAFPSSLKPLIPSDVLYKKVEQLNPTVILPGFHRKATEVLKTEAALGEFGLANAQLASTAGKATKATSQTVDPAVKWLGDEFGEQIQTAPRELPFSLVQDIRKRLGERIGALRVAGGEELGSYKQLFKTLSKDLENAADDEVSEAFKLLKKANAAANREFSIGELDDVFKETMGRALEGQEFTSSAFAKALNKIRDMRRTDELFKKGLGEANLNRIESQLDELRKLKINPPPKGANVGSMLLGRQMGLAGGIGTAIGAAVGGPIGATVGGGIGVATGAGVPWAISRIMQSPKAADMLVRVLKKDGTVSAQNISALIAIASTQDTENKKFMESFTTKMKAPELPIQEKINAAMEMDELRKLDKSSNELLSEY